MPLSDNGFQDKIYLPGILFPIHPCSCKGLSHPLHPFFSDEMIAKYPKVPVHSGTLAAWVLHKQNIRFPCYNAYENTYEMPVRIHTPYLHAVP